jgi:hypothetical protein
MLLDGNRVGRYVTPDRVKQSSGWIRLTFVGNHEG